MTILDYCRNVYSRYNTAVRRTYYRNYNMHNHDALIGFLKLDISGDYIECPNAFFYHLKRFKEDLGYEEIAIPLFKLPSPPERKTFGSVLKAFNSDKLTSVIVNDTIYYGNNYMILDENLNVLLLHTVAGNFNPDMIIRKEFICRINSKIFDEDVKNKFIESRIRKLVIPKYAANTIYRNKIKIIIDDLSQFVKGVKKPKIGEIKDFKNILLSNIEELKRCD